LRRETRNEVGACNVHGASATAVHDMSNPMKFDRQAAPELIIFVDAEEEFDWHTYSSAATSVRNIASQHLAQNIINEFGVKPTYLVDYPVASQAEGFEPLREMAAAGMCTVGSQLHPWVNPPVDEQITLRNTFHGNLPVALERAKIERLTDTIHKNFGTRPTVFKAGRYGAGPNTTSALIDAGYRIDTSVMPLSDFSGEGGPDYSAATSLPYWIDEKQELLEIPNTAGLVGWWGGVDRRGAQALLSSVSTALRVPGLLSRLRLLERIRLTPEGISLDEARRVTMALMEQGQRLFVMSYHSSSLLPGATPYVRSQADLDRFLNWIDGYLRFFFGPLSGKPTTAEAVYEQAKAATARAAVATAA